MKTGRVFLTIICVLPQPLSAQEVSGNLQGRGVSVQAEPVADVRVTVAGSSIQGTAERGPIHKASSKSLPFRRGATRCGSSA